MNSEQDQIKPLLRSLSLRVATIMRVERIQYWKLPDQRRLLIWLQWERYFNIPMEEFLPQLILEFRRRFRVHPSDRGLGMNTAALQGPAAFSFLQSRFEKRRDKNERKVTSRDIKAMTQISNPKDYNLLMDRLRNQTQSRPKPYRNSESWCQPATSDYDRLLFELHPVFKHFIDNQDD